jgi:hypothetical protein
MANTAIDCHAVIAATNPSVTGDRERIAASGGLPVDAGDRNHRQTSTSTPDRRITCCDLMFAGMVMATISLSRCSSKPNLNAARAASLA